MLDDQNIYELLFQNIKEGIVIVNQKGIIVKVNSRLEEIFKYDKDELLGKELEVLIPFKKRAQHKNHHSEFIQKPTSRSMGQGMNLKGVCKDESLVSVEISLSFFQQGEERYSIGLVSDISKRVEAETEILQLNKNLEATVNKRTKELQESQRIYQLIARNFPEGTINVFDKDLNYVFVEGEELYAMGITSEKLIGTNYLANLPKNLHKEIRSNLEEVFRGESSSFKVSLKKNHYQINSVPLLYDENNQVSEILVVERNVTQQTNLNNQMLEALENEKALNELKTRFVSMASHEFRTPLSAILSSSDLVRKYIEREDLTKTTKHLDRIRNSVHNLIDILSDFLSIDEMESDKVQYSPKSHKIQDIFERVIEDLEVLLKPKQKIDLQFSLKKENFLVDPRILSHILNNLINNAIKYSKEDGLIEILVKDFKGGIRFEIKDYGIGIPQNEQKNLFDRFFRAQNAETIQGTGLGLYIVQRYLRIIGGTIRFESEVDSGTTFYVEIKQ